MIASQLELPVTPPPPPRLHVFDGETYEAKRDARRLSRQLDRVLALMGDGRWRTLREIADACGCSEASASARLRDLRKPPLSLEVRRARDLSVPGLWWYKVG